MPIEIKEVSTEYAQKSDFSKTIQSAIDALETIEEGVNSLLETDNSEDILQYVTNTLKPIQQKINFYKLLETELKQNKELYLIEIDSKNNSKKELKKILNLLDQRKNSTEDIDLQESCDLFKEQISTILDSMTNGKAIKKEIIMPSNLMQVIIRAPDPVLKSDTLQKNGKILNETSIESIKKHFRDNPGLKILSKKEESNPKILSEKEVSNLFNTESVSRVINFNNKLVALYEPENSSLGEGATGKTFLAQDINTGEWFALKEQVFSEDKNEYKNTNNDDTETRLSNTLKEAVSLDSEKDLLGILSLSTKDLRDPDDMNEYKIYTLMKLAHGVDSTKAKEKKYIHPENINNFAISAANILKNLHDKNRLHRDIKLENMIFDPETHVLKFVDFGLSVDLKNQKQITSKQKVGTKDYLAPEIKDKTKHEEKLYSEKSDIFALGIVFAEMLYKGTQHGSVRNSKDKESVFQWQEFLKNPDMKNFNPQEALVFGLSQAMTKENPQERISLKEVIHSLELFERYKELEKNIESKLFNTIQELSVLPNKTESKEIKIIGETLKTLIHNRNSTVDPVEKAKNFAQTLKKHEAELENLQSPTISKIFKSLIQSVNHFLKRDHSKISLQEAHSFLKENKLLHTYQQRQQVPQKKPSPKHKQVQKAQPPQQYTQQYTQRHAPQHTQKEKRSRISPKPGPGPR